MRKLIFVTLIFGVTIGLFIREWLGEEDAAAKVVTIKSRNLEFQVATRAETVEEVLAEQSEGPSTSSGNHDSTRLTTGYSLSEPEASRRVIHGTIINVIKPITIILTDAGNPREIQTTAETVWDLLNLEKIGLALTDQVRPPLENYLADGMQIIIDRIVDLEVTEVNDIAYEIEIVHDPTMHYGRGEVVRAGNSGKKEQKFLITYKNGVETKRKLLLEKILQNPQREVRRFGTKIEVENIEEGRASWYVYKKCLCAAHPSYAFGRYVRVTSLDTGKSIIVRINDRGPAQAIYPDRVIDLDAAAFRELAPLSSGTIGVRAELLKN